MGHRPGHTYIVRTPVEAEEAPKLPAGPPPDYVSARRYLRFLSTLARRQPDLTIVLEDIHDPFNLSAVLRTCEAVGVGTVHLLYTRDHPPRISSRVSASAQKWLVLRFHCSVEEAYAALRSQGLRIYATGRVQGALAPHEADLVSPCAVVLGNENRGLSAEALGQADAVLYIPMRGMVPSVNVTVAAGMILYEAQRQRTLAGLYNAPRLPELEWQALLSRWLARELKR